MPLFGKQSSEEVGVVSQSHDRVLENLRQGFNRADQRWPGLQHAFVQFDQDALLPYVVSGELDFMHETLPRAVVGPLVHEQTILKCSYSWFLSMGRGFCYTVYFDDTPGGRSAVRLFAQLAVAACRCVLPHFAPLMPCGEYWFPSFWADIWLELLYSFGQEHSDPLLYVRELRLKVATDGTRFSLTPGYRTSVPLGDAPGLEQPRPWRDVLEDCARLGACVDVLDTGVFRASAYTIERLLHKEALPQNLWVVESVLGLRPSPRDFLRHGSGVRRAQKEAPRPSRRRGQVAPSAHRQPGYPLPGCVPAEPGSVSPSAWRGYTIAPVKNKRWCDAPPEVPVDWFWKQNRSPESSNDAGQDCAQSCSQGQGLRLSEGPVRR